MYRVIILSHRDIPSGVIYDGEINTNDIDNYDSDESLAEQILRILREEHYDIQNGDIMFFPYAMRFHRALEVIDKGLRSRILSEVL